MEARERHAAPTPPHPIYRPPARTQRFGPLRSRSGGVLGWRETPHSCESGAERPPAQPPARPFSASTAAPRDPQT
eukprot:13563328-Alexandrium_andersonii.AAC.1